MTLFGRLPFFCQKLPFVGHLRPKCEPFVCYYLPSVDYRSFRGFTLTELMVTLVVAGILVTIAVPSFRGFLLSNRLTTATNDLVADFQVARSEAIKRAASTIVCKSSNGTSCTSGGSWSDGWIVFVDTDGSGTWTQTAGMEDVRVRTHEALSSGLSIDDTAGPAVVVFNRQGALAPPTSPGSYVICSAALKKARTVELSVTGRTRVVEGSC